MKFKDQFEPYLYWFQSVRMCAVHRLENIAEKPQTPNNTAMHQLKLIIRDKTQPCVAPRRQAVNCCGLLALVSDTNSTV